MKLKNIATVGLIIALFFIVAALFINFDLVPNINSFTEVSRTQMNELSTQSNEIGLATNALSIAYQTDPVFYNSILNEQRTQLLLSSQNLSESLIALNTTLIDIDRISIGRHARLINDMLEKIDTLNNLNEQLNVVTSTPTLSINALVRLNQDMKASVLSIDANVNLLNNRIIQDMSVLLNVTVIMLIGIIMILLFGVFQLVNHLLPNIITSLKIISSADVLHETLPVINPYYSEAKKIKEDIHLIFDEKKFIVELQNKLLDVYVVEDTMNVLYDFLSRQLRIDRIGLAYVDYQSETFVAEYGVLAYQETILGPGFVQPFSKTSLTQILTTQLPVINNSIQSSLYSNPTSEALNMLQREKIQSNLTIPIIMNQIVFGFIFLSSYEANFFNQKHIELGMKVANEVKSLLHRAYFTNVVLTKMTSAFSELVENKDNDTGNHILRMVKYSSLLARAIRTRNHPDYPMDEKTILEVERYAAVHDIGKVGIPDAVLKKESKLTHEEWEIMKKHPKIGADVFKNLRLALNAFDSTLYQVAEDITRYHHERWDGLGYPYGLRGFEIPLVARLIAVADVFDALSSKRSYKPAFSFEESLQIIKNASESQLDPFIVEVFIEESTQVLAIYNAFN